MADNNQKTTNDLLVDIYNLLKDSTKSGALRTDSTSRLEDKLIQANNHAIEQDRIFNENTKKYINKQNTGFINNMRKVMRGQGSTINIPYSGVLRNIGNLAYERTTRQAIRNYLRKNNRDFSESSIDNFRKAHPEFRGNLGTLGFLGSLVNIFAKLAKGVSSVTFLFTIFADALKAWGEARDFYVPSIRQGYGKTIGSLYGQSMYTLQQLRTPLGPAQAYANNTAFKKSIAEIMSSGVLNDDTVRSSNDVIKSFRFIASQGLILGETFEETAKNYMNLASIYNLSFAGSRSNLEGYKYVNKLLAVGISEGFSKSGLQQLLMQYDKAAAVSQGGILKAFRDFEVMFQTIKDINPDRNQMPQYLNMFQNLMSGKVSNLSTFAALVAGGEVAYSKGQLNKLAEEYQDSSGFAQKIIAFRNLQRKTGVGTALLTELNKSEFGAFANKQGREILDRLARNPEINRRYLNEARNLSPAEQAKWMQENLKDLNITDEDRLSIEKLAQVTEVMSNPLQTLVTLVTGILNLLYSWFSEGTIKMLIGNGNINLGGGERFLVATKTGKALNQNTQRYG